MSRAEPIVQTPSWWDRRHGREDGFLVAYFCMEFGLDESLPLYSGGLGVLAGDHLKAASELGVPLVGVGPLYRDGYFRQSLDAKGRQAEAPQPVDPELDLLSRREREVLRYIARGYTYKEVAHELHISVKTVETHVSSVLRKLQLSNRYELTRWAADRRLV
jgi:glucan phosphorylase